MLPRKHAFNGILFEVPQRITVLCNVWAASVALRLSMVMFLKRAGTVILCAPAHRLVSRGIPNPKNPKNPKKLSKSRNLPRTMEMVLPGLGIAYGDDDEDAKESWGDAARRLTGLLSENCGSGFIHHTSEGFFLAVSGGCFQYFPSPAPFSSMIWGSECTGQFL